jgi:5'-3' exoribonuclease 1
MGIPFYFGEIISKSPLTKRFNIISDKLPQRSTRLFLDFNSIIHPCSAEVVSRLSNKVEVNDLLYKSIFDKITDYTLNLIDIAKPSELLFVAIDGVAPRAKMNQQRKRRYLSAQRNMRIADFKSKNDIPHVTWDSNCITPGTDFMLKLDMYLETHFKAKVSQKFPLLKDIIISGSTERGEGEHKMIKFIKQNNAVSHYDVIYGLDADLIMLSLTSHNANIVLMRESNDFGHLQSKTKVPFKFLVIQNLKESIYAVLRNDESTIIQDSDAEEKTLKSLNNLINDYVVICFCLGNDFIPSLSFLRIKEGAVDILLDCYKKACKDSNLVLYDSILNVYKVNFTVFENFIAELRKCEDEMMHCVVEHFGNTLPKPQRNFNNYVRTVKQHNPHLSLKEAQERAVRDFSMDLEEYPLRFKPLFEITPKCDKKWRNSYYHNILGSNSPEIVNDACKQYINGLLWTLNYYFDLSASTEWYYPMHYAPCASDMLKYIMSLSEDEVNQQKTALMNSENVSTLNESHIQLLLVLPPQSRNLIPVHLQKIMTDVNLGCVHFYPHTFNVHTYLRYKMWECSPIIPNIDKNKIVTQIMKIAMD